MLRTIRASTCEGEGDRLWWKGRKICRNVQKIDLSVIRSFLADDSLRPSSQSQIAPLFGYKHATGMFQIVKKASQNFVRKDETEFNLFFVATCA